MTAVLPAEKPKSKPLRFLLARLAEGSTYRGIFMIAAAGGAVLRPEVGEAIMAAGIAVAGLIGVLFPDTPSTAE